MGVFIFPPHLFSAPILPWETVKTQISVKIKIMKLSQKLAILIKKICICQSSMVHKGC